TPPRSRACCSLPKPSSPSSRRRKKLLQCPAAEWVAWAAWITKPTPRSIITKLQQQPDSQESGCFALKIFFSDKLLGFGGVFRVIVNRRRRLMLWSGQPYSQLRHSDVAVRRRRLTK